tara:strand:+ start:96 stop:386 length:291 start_codon:yes stop_codon:yes gene_type:complete
MMRIVHRHLRLNLVYRLKEMYHQFLVCKKLDHMILVLHHRLRHGRLILKIHRLVGLALDLLEVCYLRIHRLVLHHHLEGLLRPILLWLLLFLLLQR